MEKKLYFLNVNSLNDEETHAMLSNEEFAKRAEIVYDSILIQKTSKMEIFATYPKSQKKDWHRICAMTFTIVLPKLNWTQKYHTQKTKINYGKISRRSKKEVRRGKYVLRN